MHAKQGRYGLWIAVTYLLTVCFVYVLFKSDRLNTTYIFLGFYYSTFTRVQRLSCCLSLLYCSMIANAMFHRTEETVNKPTAIRLGPFTFTLQQFFVGFISALVVMPVNVAIVTIFRKSKPSKTKDASLPTEVQEKLDEVGENIKRPLPETEVVVQGVEEAPPPYEAYDPKEEMETIDGVPLAENECPEADNPTTNYLKVPDGNAALRSSTSSETLEAMDSLPQSRQDLTAITPPISRNDSLTSRSSAYTVDIEETPTKVKEKINDGKSEKEKKKKKKKKKKEEFMLPHWCVYIGWFLFAVSCIVSAFFTILYSLEWGKEKSNEWLTSMLLSFFNSVVLIQPIKVSIMGIPHKITIGEVKS